MLKKAIFAEISLFAAVKSSFYSFPVSAFLFPAPTKLVFLPKRRFTWNNLQNGYGLSCSVCYCNFAITLFPPFRHALFPCRAFPEWPPDDDETEFDLHFSRFLTFKPVSRETFHQNAVERSRLDVFFCILSAFHTKHSLKTAPGDMPFNAWKWFRVKTLKSRLPSPVCDDFYFLCFAWNIRDRTSHQKEKARESGE